jgi:hypothetical protein
VDHNRRAESSSPSSLSAGGWAKRVSSSRMRLGFQIQSGLRKRRPLFHVEHYEEFKKERIISSAMFHVEHLRWRVQARSGEQDPKE